MIHWDYGRQLQAKAEFRKLSHFYQTLQVLSLYKCNGDKQNGNLHDLCIVISGVFRDNSCLVLIFAASIIIQGLSETKWVRHYIFWAISVWLEKLR